MMDPSMEGMGGSSSLTPLNDSGVYFSNETQALNFLQDMLDDSILQHSGELVARYFWYGMVVFIGLAAISNLLHKMILQMRIRAAAANKPKPAKANDLFTQCVATMTAITRELSYPQFSPLRFSSYCKVPPMGTIVMISLYLGFLLALEFIHDDVAGAQHYTAIGVRTGWLAVAQVPLLILLAGKNNLIGFVTGSSYERLNVYHRWVARGLLLLATIHFGAQSYGWNEYGLMQLEWSTDTCPPTGIAVYAILLWMNLSTLAPMRNFSYEFFVAQHLITFLGFIIAVMWHLPSTALHSRVYIYIPIGLYLLDRLIRTCRLGYNNIRSARATLETLEGDVTKVRVNNPQIQKWTPGSFVLLSIHEFGMLQSHPATIASIPTSHENGLVFILKCHKGFTRKILEAGKSSSAPEDSKEVEVATAPGTHRVFIDGPYGGSNTNFAAFDTVVLISGSTGVTFTLPLFLDIAHRAAASPGKKLPVRRIEFIWIVKNTSWTSWISDELMGSFDEARAAGIEVTIKIFVTCDESFTDHLNGRDEKECGCDCDKSLGPCCCIAIESADEGSGSIRGGEKSNETTATAATAQVASSSSAAASMKSRYRKMNSCATLISGRPATYTILTELAEQAEGEMGIAVCGPLGLSSSVRRGVAQLSDERAVHKGTGAQGIFLHVEGFGW